MTINIEEHLDLAGRDAKMQRKLRNLAKRQKALSIPITAEDIIYHSQFLAVVNYSGETCWIYTQRSTGGRTNAYARLKYHGVWVPAHRFALAVKLGCTLWDLEDSKAGHAKVATCMGGRCCKHVHLRKEKTTAAGAWQRARDKQDVGNKPDRTPEETRRLVRYTCDLPVTDCRKLNMGENVIGGGESAFSIWLL